VLSSALPPPAASASVFERRAGVKRWPLLRALQCGLELAEALRYCHDGAISGFKVLHRDLKPDNIGFRPDGTVVLFDFGLAKLWKVDPELPADSRQLTGQTGSARYMAPEVALSQRYGASAEVYSFAVILWQLASHQRPYGGLSLDAFKTRVVEGGVRPPLQRSWPQPLATLISECWDQDPARRPTFTEVCPRLQAILDGLTPPGSAGSGTPRGGRPRTA